MTEKKAMGRKKQQYPHLWVSGPDPRRHEQYIAWLRHRAQANYRGEIYSLTFEQWADIWDQDSAWENRGRGCEDLCLSILNPKLGWRSDNVKVVTRLEQLRLHGFARAGMKYRRRSHD